MKVIFLDIDGVLNYRYCKSKLGSIYFVDDNKIKLLKQIVEATDAKIVLSSTWRYGWFDLDNENPNSSFAQDFIALRDKLKENGLELMSRTPITKEAYRGTEIDMWLKSWGGEPIESFIIIDDDSDLKPYRNRWIQTSFDKGLKPNHVKRAVRLLNYGKFDSNDKNRLEELVKKAYEYNSVGGALHIVLEDDNIEDEHILWCLENSIPEIKDTEERAVYQELAERLLQYPYSKRLNVL